MADAPKRLGVVGAGTMGAGIAQLGALAGMETVVYDALPDALERGVALVQRNLGKGAERGRWSPEDADAAAARLQTASALGGLAGCEFVVEAAPERFELKRELFQQLGDVCGDDVVLASNTSSIPITQIAGIARTPENVIGLHFFNPAPLMKLVELIPALQTSEQALARGHAVGEAMGKTVIRASDGPGFLVNRCGRPFGSEGLRLLQERLATIEQIDHIYREGGGYRMGPFELMDLVGIDVGFEVAKSFTELSFGEPRWKPNPLQAKMVAAGRLGRKTGHGWYEYDKAGVPKKPKNRDSPGSRGAGYAGGTQTADNRDCPGSRGGGYDGGTQTADDRDCPGSRGRGYDGGTQTADDRDCPGWPAGGDALLDRVQCCIVNEAVFALGEGVGSAEDIDTGTKLGLNWPKGPFELGRELGFDHVLQTMDALFDRYHEERYRAAPLLRDGVRGL